jgi:signal transduction histidine kinase
MEPSRTQKSDDQSSTFQELFSAVVLTSIMIKVLALIMVISLVCQNSLFWHNQFIWLGIAVLILLSALAVYHLGINLPHPELSLTPPGLGYPLFALVLAIGILLPAQQYFSYLNALLLFPMVIATLLLGHRGMVVAFVGLVCLLGLSLYYRDQVTIWQFTDNILSGAVVLFVAWLVGEATELNRRATRSLSETSQLLQTILDALPTGILTQDHTRRIISANRYLHQLIGSNQELEGDRSTPGTPTPKNLETIRALAADLESGMNMGEIRSSEGTPIPVQVSCYPVTLHNREAHLILVQNLSDQQKLRELDLTLHRVLEGWEIGIIFLDGENQVRIHNQAARRYLKLDSNINGNSGADILRKLELKTPNRFQEQATRNAKITLDGRYLLIDRATWHQSPDDRPWTIITIHNITEQEKAELEIQRVNNLSALGQIAAGVAHELRNPLTSIKGFAQLASEQDDPEKNNRYMEIVLREIAHMQEILDRFLFMAKPTQPAYQVTDLRQIVFWVWELLHNESLHREIRLEKILAPDELTAKIDPQLMRQVILNLVNNAFDATPAGGSVRIITRGTDKEIHLTIADTGSGIPAHLLDEIFVPFFTTKEQGTGLGLAISYEVVRKHGGTLKAKSSSSGTALHLTLPRIRPERETPS